MRSFLSNIRPAWTIERQEAALDAKVPGWRSGPVYRDVLPPRKRKSHGAADLVQRADMLRPTRRRVPDAVYVAALPVLAWTPKDFMAVLTALAAKNATLVSLDDGVTVPPDAEAATIAAAVNAFDKALRRVGDGLLTGGMSSGIRRAARAEAACKAMEPYWALPSKDYATASLLAEFKVSKPTAIKYLGYREKAQRKREIAEAVAASNRARRRETDD